MKRDMFTLEKQLVKEILREKLKDDKTAEQIYKMLEIASNEEKSERLERQKAGIQKARDNGVALGRPRLKLPDNFEQLYEEWEKGNIHAATAAKACNMGMSTFYRVIRRYRQGEDGSNVDNQKDHDKNGK